MKIGYAHLKSTNFQHSGHHEPKDPEKKTGLLGTHNPSKNSSIWLREPNHAEVSSILVLCDPLKCPYRQWFAALVVFGELLQMRSLSGAQLWNPSCTTSEFATHQIPKTPDRCWCVIDVGEGSVQFLHNEFSDMFSV